MPPLKLLVVEDNLVSLELMTEVFTSLQAEVVPISDSKKASGLVDLERFDGIFLDLEMPQLHGFDLAQHIRKSSWNKSTPIIIVTGREDRQTMQQAFTLGATFFLQKPVDRRKLSGLFRTVRGGLFEFRRRHLRVPLQTEITCVAGSQTIHGVTRNLSQGGMQIEADGLHLGDTVHLAFELPVTAGIIEATGSLVWAKDHLLGIGFTQVSEQAQEKIREFVAQSEKLRES